MKLRSALFLMAAAGGLVPPGAGNGSSESSTPSAPAGNQPPETGGEKDKGDSVTKRLQNEWKGKSYAAIAAHHVALCQAGRHDEAVVFHDAVVKSFRDKK